MILTNEWIEQGIEQGIEKGIEQGKAAGLLEGQNKVLRSVVRRLLDSRSIDSAHLVIDRLDHLSDQQLSNLTDALLNLKEPFDPRHWLATQQGL